MNCLLSGAITRMGGAQKRADGVAGAKYSTVKVPGCKPLIDVRFYIFYHFFLLNGKYKVNNSQMA